MSVTRAGEPLQAKAAILHLLVAKEVIQEPAARVAVATSSQHRS